MFSSSIADTRLLSATERTVIPIGSHAQDTTITAAETLTAPAGARKLFIQVLGSANIRVRFDGVDPTASIGFQIKPDDGIVCLYVGTGVGVRVIAESGSPEIQYQWSE